MNLRSEFDRVMAFPVLTRDEELEAFRAWRERDDRRAFDRIINAHLRIVVRHTRANRNYGLPEEDLYQEGAIGLVHAAHRFDPARGYRFVTCADWWVRAAVLDHVIRHKSVVRLGANQRQKDLFFNLRRERARFEAEMPNASTADVNAALAKHFGATVRDVERVTVALQAGDHALDMPLSDEDGASYIDMLADERPDPEQALAETRDRARAISCVQAAVASLSDRERAIFSARHLRDEPTGLLELSGQFSISKERVRQIGEIAMQKVARRVRAGASA